LDGICIELGEFMTARYPPRTITVNKKVVDIIVKHCRTGSEAGHPFLLVRVILFQKSGRAEMFAVKY